MALVMNLPSPTPIILAGEIERDEEILGAGETGSRGDGRRGRHIFIEVVEREGREALGGLTWTVGLVVLGV